jgi:peptidylprolyl isomerase
MSKNIMPLLIVVVVVGIGITGIFLLSNQKTQTSDLNINTNVSPQPTSVIISSPTPKVTIAETMNNTRTTESGLKIQDLVVGSGPGVKPGSTVTVHYLGTLENGTKFDSSYDRGTPFTTQIGVGQVIQGWDEGIVGMKIGGKRKLTIPADLGYGAQANGAIPANSTLIFEVELIDFRE